MEIDLLETQIEWTKREIRRLGPSRELIDCSRTYLHQWCVLIQEVASRESNNLGDPN